MNSSRVHLADRDVTSEVGDIEWWGDVGFRERRKREQGLPRGISCQGYEVAMSRLLRMHSGANTPVSLLEVGYSVVEVDGMEGENEAGEVCLLACDATSRPRESSTDQDEFLEKEIRNSLWGRSYLYLKWKDCPGWPFDPEYLCNT